MEQPKVTHSTFVVERSFAQSPETVFAAFADPAKARRWYAEGEGHELQEFNSDFRVGGTQTLRYTLGPGTPVAGMTINNQARYQEIQPNRRIVTAATMDLGDKRIMAAQVTIELLPGASGTDLILTNQGAFFENGLTPEMIEAGWRGLLEKLASDL
ncbi:MAG TPA: SRPBCC domain-containing protein [Terracidiphilus sp.]|jgi:uncharacterized protein YndB with AHSA1/START domain